MNVSHEIGASGGWAWVVSWADVSVSGGWTRRGPEADRVTTTTRRTKKAAELSVNEAGYREIARWAVLQSSRSGLPIRMSVRVPYRLRPVGSADLRAALFAALEEDLVPELPVLGPTVHRQMRVTLELAARAQAAVTLSGESLSSLVTRGLLATRAGWAL